MKGFVQPHAGDWVMDYLDRGNGNLSPLMEDALNHPPIVDKVEEVEAAAEGPSGLIRTPFDTPCPMDPRKEHILPQD